MPNPPHPRPPPHPNPEPRVVEVSVAYVGTHPYNHGYPADTTFLAIKLDAMSKFKLDAAAAAKYVLQHGGADLADTGHVGDLGQHKVDLELTLVEDVPKGSRVHAV